MFKNLFKEKFLVFENSDLPSFGDETLDFGALAKGPTQKEKPPTPEELLRKAKSEAIDAQDNYAKAQDAAVTTYNEISEIVTTNPELKETFNKGMFYIAETASSPYYRVTVVDGEDKGSPIKTVDFQITTSVENLSRSSDPANDKGKDKPTLLLEKKDRFRAATSAFNDLEARFKEVLAVVRKKQDEEDADRTLSAQLDK
ncbi:MAG: hypothetical protein WCX95_02035 [Candidatus Gracilibacteria bacterium]